MTENEAKIFIQNAMEQSKKTLAELLLISPKVFAVRKKSLGEYYSNLENCKKEIQSCEVAVQALEELKTTMQYVRLAKAHRTVGKAIEECAKYEKIGTPEECKIAVEKQRPRKPINPDDDYGTFKCPNCNGLIFTEGRFETHKYCLLCGQKLDWRNEE